MQRSLIVATIMLLSARCLGYKCHSKCRI